MDHEFATKEDFKRVEASLSDQIQALRHEVRSDLQVAKAESKSLEYRMTIKMGLIQVASVGFLASLIKFF